MVDVRLKVALMTKLKVYGQFHSLNKSRQLGIDTWNNYIMML